VSELLLGRTTPSPETYTPSVLHPIPRKRSPLVPYGHDFWRCYELSWINSSGKPEVAICEVVYPVESTCIVESKSLKLYLNSFSQSRFASFKEVEETVFHDLRTILDPEWIEVTIIPQERFPCLRWQETPDGICIDRIDVSIDTFQPDPGLLLTEISPVQETLYSDLLRTLCPITAQPDWASVIISYAGPQIIHASLLRYLCSFRHHSGFSEECCEQIFTDIHHRCAPDRLEVRCCYTRRGGVDITPLRSSAPVPRDSICSPRLIRQ